MIEKVNMKHPDKVADRIAGAVVDLAYKVANNPKIAVELCCAIGDDSIDGKEYSEIVEIAREYISAIGGFEKFAEWGLY